LHEKNGTDDDDADAIDMQLFRASSSVDENGKG
jgi:hypothetical protein